MFKIIIFFIIPMIQQMSFAFDQNKIYPQSKSPLVGVIQTVEQKGEKLAYLHQYLFRFEDGQWKGALLNDYMGSAPGPKEVNHSTMDIPVEIKMNIYFDGRTLGLVTIAPKACLAPVKQVTKSVKKLTEKYKVFVTSSIKHPKDPDSWKPILIGQASFQEDEIHEAWKNSDLCKNGVSNSLFKESEKNGTKKEYGTRTEKRKANLKIKKIYAPKDKSRFLVIAEKDEDCISPEGSDDFARKVWLFRNTSSKWILKEGNDLIDIGDFNEDGINEAIFYGSPYPPQISYELLNMNTFELLVHVEASGGDGGGLCFSNIGG